MATTLTITLTDAQWAAYRAVSSNPSTSDVETWLKTQLTADYDAKLEGVDQTTAASTKATAKAARDIKVAAF